MTKSIEGKVEMICPKCGCMDWLHTMYEVSCKKCKKDYKKNTIEFTFCESDEVRMEGNFRIYKPNALG